MILCIDTAHSTCSLALVDVEGKVLRQVADTKKNGATERINVLLEQLLPPQEGGFSVLSAVAISGGPGSYTGLRIATSTAKGICFALNIPLIHVDTLEAMVHGIMLRDPEAAHYELLVPMIDARRMEVYTATYSAALEEVAPARPVILEESFLEEFMPASKVLFFGDGAFKLKTFMGNTAFRIEEHFIPDAIDMALLAAKKYANRDWVDTAYYEPNYLKAFYTGK